MELAPKTVQITIFQWESISCDQNNNASNSHIKWSKGVAVLWTFPLCYTDSSSQPPDTTDLVIGLLFSDDEYHIFRPSFLIQSNGTMLNIHSCFCPLTISALSANTEYQKKTFIWKSGAEDERQ